MSALQITVVVGSVTVVAGLIYGLLQPPREPEPTPVPTALGHETVLVEPLDELAVERDHHAVNVAPPAVTREGTSIEARLRPLRLDNTEWENFERVLSLLLEWASLHPEAALDWALNLLENEETRQLQFEFLSHLAKSQPDIVAAHFERFPVSKFSVPFVRSFAVAIAESDFQQAMDWVNSLPNTDMQTAGRWALYKHGLTQAPLTMVDVVAQDPNLDDVRQQGLLKQAFLAQLQQDPDFSNTPIGYYRGKTQLALIDALVEHGELIEGLSVSQWLSTQAAGEIKDHVLVALRYNSDSYAQQLAYGVQIEEPALRAMSVATSVKAWAAVEPQQAQRALRDSGLPMAEVQPILQRLFGDK